MPMPKPKLKFRWMRRWTQMRNYSEPIPTPNGYRLATVEEVRNHFNTIAGLGIAPLTRDLPPIPGGVGMRLLDGYMTYPNHGHFQLQQTFKRCLSFKVVVKEKEWDEHAGSWRTKGSACSLSDGILLRNQLYHHLGLSNEARQTALLYACEYCEYCDTEVVYWLLTTTSSEELKSLKLLFNKHSFCDNDPYYITIVGCLLKSKFPFQPIQDSCGITATHFAILFATAFNHKELDMHIVDLLVGLFSAEIVDWKNSEGMSFLDVAKNEKRLTHIFTKLLSISERPLENHLPSIKPRFQAVFFEAVERGYEQLVEKLLELKSEITIDASLVMQVLRDTVRKGSFPLLQKLLTWYRTEISDELTGKDKDQKTLLHYAAESGNRDVFRLLLASFDSVHGVDRFGKNVLHCAAQGKSGYQIVDVLKEKESTLLELMNSRDNKGRTPLHIASSKGKKNMVYKLLDLLRVDTDEVDKYVKETDSFGRTALQMACRGGHRVVVKALVYDGKWDLLKERDVNGKTALHYAAEAGDPKDAVAICEQLLRSCRDSSKRSLLLWASADGTGTADEGIGVHSFVKAFLESEKASDKTHLLREAALRNNVEMAWELLNRGADIHDLRDPEWDQITNSSVANVLHQLELLREQGQDQPSMEDKLGRNVFADGLAALFLNRFIASPVTVGIYGEWGMGKSSLMIQTEKILLITAAQLTFPNLLKFENFVGAKKVSLSTEGRKIYETFKRGAYSLSVQGEDRPQEILFFKLYRKFKELVRNFSPSARYRFREEVTRKFSPSAGHILKGEDPLVNILQEYKPEFHGIYKSLACMQSCQVINSPKRTLFSQEDCALTQVPRILTIQYNAWHYREQHEAWAGLAVTITKEIENSMTRAQWFSTCWRYTWNKNNFNIYFRVFLPCFLASFLAGWIAWAAWILLKKDKFKELKYGPIPLTIIAIVWIVLKSVMSVVKPVSVQMLAYITSPNHTNQLGYQEQVISDINFLKKELGRPPHWFFSFISGEWCWNWFGLCADNLENTSIRKFRPASEEQLRIITFVDDLDRCEEKVILQVLSALNLVLARCKINVVMGIDKKMIERAIRRSFDDVEDHDLAEKFLCKIIQIPLSLPDPTEDETNNFLAYHLGHDLQDGIPLEDDYTDYSTEDEIQEEISGDDVIHEEINAEDVIHDEISVEDDDNTVVEIACCNPSHTRCQGITQKAAHWLTYFLKCCFSIACSILSELKHMEDQSGDENLRPLASSKGARLTREMLISKYTKEEADTFKKLKRFATGNQKHPREWKRLFNYHKLAWNILSKRRHVYPTWKVELAVWIFVCWQWKHEMNTLIKGWSRFARLAWQNESGDARDGHGPSLREIVEKCLVELKNSEKSKQQEGNVTAKTGDDLFKVRQEDLLRVYVRGHVKDVIDEGPSHNSWKKLRKALKIQDVSMKGIQLFQQFRLHCETDHLPWPLDDESDDDELEL